LTEPRYDFLIIGAGLYGACFARIATDSGKRVLVLERRNHIAGNCFTETVNGIHIHRYGPHIFHTSNQQVWDFLCQYVTFNNFVNSPLALSQGELFSLPFNMYTFYKMWGLRWPHEVQAKLSEQCLKLDRSPENLEEQALTLVGHDIYERLIKGYTQKQWQKHPLELPASIIKRLPLRLTFDNNYFNDRYQGIPQGGYTALFEKLLDGIDVRTGIDYHQNRQLWDDQASRIVYTGKIDELFNYDQGELEYRALRFEDEWHQQSNYQGNAVINYCDADVPYTRMIEHRHFDPPQAQESPSTVVTREIPVRWQRSETPYYPINDQRNASLYQVYLQRSESLPNLILGGRLAEYKYYDMHAVVASALLKTKQLGLRHSAA